MALKSSQSTTNQKAFQIQVTYLEVNKDENIFSHAILAISVTMKIS